MKIEKVINGKLNPDLGLNIEGDLYLEGADITQLPDNLSVKGFLDLRDTEITQLPENLNVNGDLFLSGTKITQLPDDLNVNGGLFLERTNITNYPVVYDCGRSKRAIYLDLKDKNIIHIGCFQGTKDQAIEAIKKEYCQEEAEKYIEKVEQCFEMVS